jgi:HD-like signal output (HDOD) protein/DNA-binding response OmpR family regulator
VADVAPEAAPIARRDHGVPQSPGGFAIADSQTILVVDDQAIIREPLGVVLRTAGFQVITASNGVDAIKAIQTSHIDLILLDLAMPVMDGLAVLKRVRAVHATSGIPVLVLSVAADKARVLEAVELGIQGYVLKSNFSLKDLLERVRKALFKKEKNSEPDNAAASTTPGQETSSTTQSKPAAETAQPAAQQNAADRVFQLTQDSEASLRELRPLVSRSAIVEMLSKQGELTGFSPTVTQVLTITSNPNCSMESVARAVSQDQAVALKILKLANSPIYAHGDRVDSVQKAVLRIGIQNIRQTVLNIGVVERFGSLAFERHMSTPLFWEHSIACGLIAAALAHALKQPEPDIAFTAGLFHDLGRIILSEGLGETYVKVLDTAASLGCPLEQVESRLLLMNHAEVMDRLLNAWHMPKALVRPIVLHHTPPGEVKSLASTQVADVLRLGLANRLAHALMLGSSGNDTIYPTEEHCRLLGVDAAAITRIRESARMQTDEAKIVLLTTSSGTVWPRSIDKYKDALTAPFRPLCVSSAPELDAYTIFCGELASPPDGPPNVAVVHLAAPKERPELAQKLLLAEQAAQVQGLPLLLLTANTQLRLPPEVIGNRRMAVLSTPTPVSQFIVAVNELCAGAETRAAA